MKKEEQLLNDLTELIKETQKNKVDWKVDCQTTEYNDLQEKPVHEEDGECWIVDECFVSYECTHKGKDFLLITYEQIFTCGQKKKSCNLLFMPPMGIRFYDVDTLAPYAVKADQMLTYEAHMLWLTILEKCKDKSERIKLDVSPRKLVLEQGAI